MAEPDDGLGLSLSLSLRCPEKQTRRLPPPPPDAFPSGSPLQQPDLRGFDMNRPITAIESDDHLTWTGIGMVSSPNSTLSSLSSKRSENDEDSGGDTTGRKKLYLSKDQTAVLEETYKEHNILNLRQKMAVAKRLNLRARQVEVWFQNRRARTKLKQTEVDCCYMRHCFKKLTDENRRLVKEVTELRALKLSPQFYTNTSPPTELTMCPQCQRVESRPLLSLGPP